jgi:hypothetical protein
MDEVAVPVALAASRTEAELMVGLLRSNGLRAVVSADDAGGLNPQLQLQGVRVLVAPADETSARRLLADAEKASLRTGWTGNEPGQLRRPRGAEHIPHSRALSVGHAPWISSSREPRGVSRMT